MKGPNSTSIHDYIKFIKPSATCQSCYSEQQMSKDIIITCEICRSSIHQSHYGSQLYNPPQIWRCQRCRYFLENGTDKLIKCQFCPDVRGIMKQFTYKEQKIWVHPECTTWGYPFIFFSSQLREGLRHEKIKNESTYFWAEDYDENKYPCQVCKQTNGFRIKCKYFSCKKSYHITCARPLGIVRDLQTFRIDNTDCYFPVYCRDHIQLKIADYKNRAKLMKEDNNFEKSHHFYKLSVLFQDQLANLKEAVKKCQVEEEMLQRFLMQASKAQPHKDFEVFNLSNSYHSQDSGSSFLHLLQQNLIDTQLQNKIKTFTEEREKASIKNQPRKRATLSQEQPLKEQSQKNDNKPEISQDTKKQPKKKRGPPKKSEKNLKKPAKISHKKKQPAPPIESPQKQRVKEKIVPPLEEYIPLKQDERDIERIIEGFSDDDLFGKPDHILPLHQQHSHDLQKSRYGHHKDRKRNFLSDQQEDDQQQVDKEEEDDEQYQPEQDDHQSEEQYSEQKNLGKSKRFRGFESFENVIHEPIYEPEELAELGINYQEREKQEKDEIFEEDNSQQEHQIQEQYFKKEAQTHKVQKIQKMLDENQYRQKVNNEEENEAIEKEGSEQEGILPQKQEKGVDHVANVGAEKRQVIQEGQKGEIEGMNEEIKKEQNNSKKEQEQIIGEKKIDNEEERQNDGEKGNREEDQGNREDKEDGENRGNEEDQSYMKYFENF